MTNKQATIEDDHLIRKLKKLTQQREVLYAFPGEDIEEIAAATVGTDQGWQSRIARVVGARPSEIRDAVSRARHQRANPFVVGPAAARLAMLKRRLELTGHNPQGAPH